jgi:hypothetical protein
VLPSLWSRFRDPAREHCANGSFLRARRLLRSVSPAGFPDGRYCSVSRRTLPNTALTTKRASIGCTRRSRCAAAPRYRRCSHRARATAGRTRSSPIAPYCWRDERRRSRARKAATRKAASRTPGVSTALRCGHSPNASTQCQQRICTELLRVIHARSPRRTAGRNAFAYCFEVNL